MNIRQALKLILTRKRPLIDVWHWWLGNYRYQLFFSTDRISGTLSELWWLRKKHWLMRKHIYEQIQHRINWADKQCMDNGACKVCGCETPALQMAAKPCEGFCYPPMMNRTDWDFFLKGYPYQDELTGKVWILNRERKPECINCSKQPIYVSEN